MTPSLKKPHVGWYLKPPKRSKKGHASKTLIFVQRKANKSETIEVYHVVAKMNHEVNDFQVS